MNRRKSMMKLSSHSGAACTLENVAFPCAGSGSLFLQGRVACPPAILGPTWTPLNASGLSVYRTTCFPPPAMSEYRGINIGPADPKSVSVRVRQEKSAGVQDPKKRASELS